MASKNQVTLTFAGDSTDLERTFSKVGEGAQSMGREVDSGAGAIDRVGESADGAETRFTGLASGIDGVTTLMDDPSPQEFAQGLADMADGIANFVVPTIKTMATQLLATGRAAVTSAAQHVAAAARTVAGWVLMGAQAALNAARMAAAWLISLGPIGLIIAAVGVVIGILVALGVGFDDVARWAQAAWDLILGAAQAVWNWLASNWPLILAILTGPIGLAVLAIVKHWDTIKGAFGSALDWIKSTASSVLDSVVGFFSALPGRLLGLIGSFASAGASLGSSILGGVTGAISSAWGFASDMASGLVSAVTSAWNSFAGAVNGLIPNSLGWGPASIDLPDNPIPTFHTGGVFSAPDGQREGLAMLLDGERVMRPGQSDGMTVVVNVAGSIRSDRDLVKVIRDELARGGMRGVR